MSTRIRTKEYRLKQSITQKGLKMKPFSEQAKINMSNGQKGKKFSKEHKLKLSNNMKKRWKEKEFKDTFFSKVSGENNWRYKKDRTQLVKSEKKHLDGRYREWMFGVKNRDNWKCRIADVNCDGRLTAHHILNWKDYPELRYKINNGITLCHAHHPRGRENEAKMSPFFQKIVAKNN